jgi:hypothetical protein
MLDRVLEKLGNSPALYHNIDVDRIRRKIIDMKKYNTLTRFEI